MVFGTVLGSESLNALLRLLNCAVLGTVLGGESLNALRRLLNFKVLFIVLGGEGLNRLSLLVILGDELSLLLSKLTNDTCGVAKDGGSAIQVGGGCISAVCCSLKLVRQITLERKETVVIAVGRHGQG